MTKNQFLTEVNKYLEKIEDNFEESTYKEKRRKLRKYSEYFYQLYTQGVISTCDPKKLTAADIYEYQLFRMKTVSNVTLHKDFSILNGFFDTLKVNVMREYKAIYGNKKPSGFGGRIDPLPNKVIDRVYRLARETDRWDVLEGCVAIIMGCSAGIRPQEIRKLLVEDLHHKEDRPYVFVRHPKGEGEWGRPRKAPLNDDPQDIIDKYLGMRAERVEQWSVDSDALFPPLMKKNGTVTMESINKKKRIVENILGEKFKLKDARRAYGQRMLDNGVPIESVSYAMGHDSIETTQKYYANYRERAVLDNIYSVMKGRQGSMP